MVYRRFGRTGLRMPVLTCGGMRFQYKWQDVPLEDIPPDDQTNVERTVLRAVELGINHIETARGYGSSERQLGEVLSALPREKIIVQTKVNPLENPQNFLSGVNDSLARLKLDYLDLLGIHGINNDETFEWATRPGGCLAAARKLQRQGKVRHVGFSTHNATDVILRAIRHEGDGGFDYVNMHWFYIFQNNWRAIREAARRDMGVFIISPSDKGGMLYEPTDKLVKLCEPLHPIVFNDLFCLSHPQVHTLSIGAQRPGDFQMHLKAVELLGQADEILPPIIERLERTMLQVVGEELLDPFKVNLPDWQKTPGQINIPMILWLRNLAVAYDMLAYGKMRYNLLGSGGHWFPGQNAEKLDEVDLSCALADCPIAERVVDLLREAHQMFHQKPLKRLSQSDQ